MADFREESFPGCKRIEKHIDVKQKCKRIYTITSMNPANSSDLDGRTPIVCSSLKNARHAVENNGDSFWEHAYNVVVIEALRLNYMYGGQRMFGFKEEQYWYVWDMVYNRYMPIEKPEQYKESFGFAIG